MRINPIAHGNNNNLYCSAKKYGVKLKIVMFFDVGTAYIMSVRRSNPDINVDWDAFYKELVESIKDMDFELKTQRKGFMNLNMNSEQFKYHLKDKYHVGKN
jgi:hypothetical protein